MNYKLIKEEVIMKKTKVLLMTLVGFVCAAMTISGEDSKSYAEKLADEKAAIKYFINEQKISAIDIDEDKEALYYKQRSFNKPENIHFELGQWYRMTNRENMYMQIVSYGDTDIMFGKPEGQLSMENVVLIRYDSCYNLLTYNDLSSSSVTNDNNNLAVNYAWIINPWVYGYTSTYGVGLDFPIPYIGHGGKVRLIVPSKVGMSADISNVVPYYYHSVTYKAANFPNLIE